MTISLTKSWKTACEECSLSNCHRKEEIKGGKIGDQGVRDERGRERSKIRREQENWKD